MGTTLPKRKRGTGSIAATAEGFRAYIRKPDETGVSKQLTKRFSSYQEADDWLMGLVSIPRGGVTSVTGTAKEPETVTDLFRLWLIYKNRETDNHGKPDAQTVSDYHTICKVFIVPNVGDIKLSEFNSDDIENWKDDIVAYVSSRTNKPLSAQRKYKIWQVMRQGIKHGMNKGYLKTNPSAGVTAFSPVQNDVKEKAMTERDYKLFQAVVVKRKCDHAKGYCQLRWKIAMTSGRRQGEVLGLTWDSVDLENKRMLVDNRLKVIPWKHGCRKDPETNQPSCENKQGQYCPHRRNGGLQLIEGTKIGVSNKPTINITHLIADFKTHQALQNVEREKARRAGTYSPADPSHGKLIFTQPTTQRAYNPSHDNKLFRKMLLEAGIPVDRYGIHSLRHTAATRLASSTGGDLNLIRQILGHKSIHTSMLYISTDLAAQERAMAKLVWSEPDVEQESPPVSEQEPRDEPKATSRAKKKKMKAKKRAAAV